MLFFSRQMKTYCHVYATEYIFHLLVKKTFKKTFSVVWTCRFVQMWRCWTRFCSVVRWFIFLDLLKCQRELDLVPGTVWQFGFWPLVGTLVRPVLDDGSDVGPQRRHHGGHPLHPRQLHTVHAFIQPEHQSRLRRERRLSDTTAAPPADSFPVYLSFYFICFICVFQTSFLFVPHAQRSPSVSQLRWSHWYWRTRVQIPGSLESDPEPQKYLQKDTTRNGNRCVWDAQMRAR